jgi:hypothetical protein
MKTKLDCTETIHSRAAAAVAIALSFASVLCRGANPPDFNGDGFDDLAVGAPGEGVPFLGVDRPRAGAVNVVYGSPVVGLTAAGNQFWHQNRPGMPDDPELDDEFGSALAWGDFNHDGFSDLAIGIPGEDGGLGAVDVVYGSAAGLTAYTPVAAQHFTSASVGANDEAAFGWVVASNDFDQDGYDDLAIGAPNMDVYTGTGVIVNAGQVFVLYGSAGGLTTVDFDEWDQNKGTIIGICEDYDQFGSALATGDFDNDGYGDLAIGIPYEDKEWAGAVVPDVGGVNVLYGSLTGLDDTNNEWIWQDNYGIADSCENSDYFGFSLAAGDFDSDGYEDLVVGVPNEDFALGGFVRSNAGAVHVIHGSSGGLTWVGSDFWNQGVGGIAGTLESNDFFGHSVTAGDLNGDGYADLGVGVPGESIVSGVSTYLGAGAVNTLYGSGVGVTAVASGFSHQGGIVPGTLETQDHFGWSLVTADFNGDGRADLAVGVSAEDISRAGLTYPDAGALNIMSTVLQFWYQDILAGISEAGDFSGASVYGP